MFRSVERCISGMVAVGFGHWILEISWGVPKQRMKSWESKGTRDPMPQMPRLPPKKWPALIAGLMKGNQWFLVP